jgi:hypothetical protein
MVSHQQVSCVEGAQEGKMARLCTLEIVVPGAGTSTVYVNPLLVRFIRPGTPGHTIIHFDHQDAIDVARPLRDVQTEIDAALQ